MKFIAIASLLLPASSVLANPLSVRQAERAEFVTFRTEGNGCGGASVAYSARKDVATVSLPRNAVGPAGQFSNCDIILIASYPKGKCTSGTALGQASGHVKIDSGVTATFKRGNYVVTPSLVTVIGKQNVTSFEKKVRADEDYTLKDALAYKFLTDQFNFEATFRTQGPGLQLQPAGSLPANQIFTNTQFVLDISNQTVSATC